MLHIIILITLSGVWGTRCGNRNLKVIYVIELLVRGCDSGGGFEVRVLRLFFSVVASAQSLGYDPVLGTVESNGLVVGIVHTYDLLLLRDANTNGEVQYEDYEEGDDARPYNRYHDCIQL